MIYYYNIQHAVAESSNLNNRGDIFMANGFVRNVGRAVPVLAIVVLLMGCSNALLISVQEHVTEVNALKEPLIEVSQGARLISGGGTVDFESQPSGSDTDITFSIKNTGTGNLLLQTPVVTPSSTSDGFSVQSLSGTSVSPGDSVNLVLRFRPSSGGTHNASVTLESNSNIDPSLAFSLTGVGVVPDNTAPTGSVFINSDSSYSTSTSVTLSIEASDTGGGSVQDMEIRNDTAFSGNWQSYNTSVVWTLDGPDGADIVYIRFRDNSGNTSGAYNDTIVLDRVDPTITNRTPSSGVSYIARGSNITVNFSESMNTATMTSSSVYLRNKGGSTVSTVMSKTSNSVTLNPAALLLYGYDYSIVVTNAVKDPSGRSITNFGITDFTVDRDYWEGANGNDTTANAYDMNSMIPRYPYDLDNWFDLVPDNQYEEWNLPAGVHSYLALLDGTDRYVIDPPDDAYLMEVRVLFTNDVSNGTVVNSLPTENMRLGIFNNGQGDGAFRSNTYSDLNYDKYYELDLSGRTGDFGIVVYENSGNYSNRRKYNLRIRFSTGM